MNTEKNCVAYTRFSPRPDAETSESCDLQRAYIAEYAHKKGLTVRKYVDDPDRSGCDEFRDRLWDAIALLKKGEALIVWKRDRLARNLYLAEMINRAVAKKKCRIIAVEGDVDGDGPEQILVRQIVAAMAEYERKSIAQRTRTAVRMKMKNCIRTSKLAPYGYSVSPEDEKKLVVNAGEQETLAHIKRMRNNLGLSFREIARALPPEKSRVGHWHPEVIRHICKRLEWLELERIKQS